MTSFETNGRTYAGYHAVREPVYDEELACVGPHSPCGEYMRRFWQPVALAAQLGERPLLVRCLGEDLVLFRDKRGTLGLVHKHCPHRNASLEFGIVNQRGIRCCYHGWLFDVDGTLLEAPEQANADQLCRKVRLGAYPVLDYKGLIFAYLGPPDGIPPFPLYDTCEIDGGELLPYEVTLPCNWLQVAENSMDPQHVVFLHTRVNEVQFTEKLGILPKVDWRERPIGFFYTKARRIDDVVWISTNDIVLPNFTQAGAVYESTDGETPKYFGRNSFTRWVVPLDDTHTAVRAFRHFNRHAESARDEWRTAEALERIDISELKDRPYGERQRNPGDYEAFVGQGAISAHRNETLAASDRGVILYRQRLRREIRALQAGRSPLQPSSQGTPIPTYGSDTVIRLPRSENGADGDAIRALQQRVAEIYQEGDALQGEARYAFMAERLAELNQG